MLGEAAVEFAAGEEFVVGSLVGDAAGFHDDDGVAVEDGGKTVGDDEAGALGGEVGEGRGDLGLALGVDHAGGFVKDQDGGVAQDGAGDGDAAGAGPR